MDFLLITSDRRHAGTSAVWSRSCFRIGSLLVVIVMLLGCGFEQEEVTPPMLTEVNISLDSSGFQKVYDYIDRGEQDSLLPYLDHLDPSYRVLAIYGFSGRMNDAYIEPISKAIMDPVVEVRRAGVFTLGQSRSIKVVPYVMQVFEYQDSLGVDPLTFKYALEAIGKCADSSYLSLLAGISTYQATDTLLLEGQALGVLQMAERGYQDSTATSLMVRYVTDTLYNPSVRLIASNYLSRVRDLNLSSHFDELSMAYERERNPEIRLFIALAMGKTGTKAGSWIRGKWRGEDDFQVRIGLLQGAVELPLSIRHRIWANALRDRNEMVAISAADLILEYGSSAYSEIYSNWAFSNFRPSVYARILGMGNRYISNARFRTMAQQLIIRNIQSTSDPYLKSDFIKAASFKPATARQLMAMDQEESPMIVRTSILESLIRSIDETGRINSPEKEFLIARWKSGDVAALSLLSPFIVRHRDLFPDLSRDEALWTRQSQEIPMPKGVEAKIEVEKARAELFNLSFDSDFYLQSENYTHPIDWKRYQQLSDQPTAEIITSAGVLKFDLLKTEAPGTVLNFIELSESGYYNGKFIHRVVPNFVVQGGGNRGDGYGSMDYTIRTELFPAWFDKTGLMGMASAGLHTESQQWFVTLRPTLHLNGKYTLFARMTEGREQLLSIYRGIAIEEIKIRR